MKILNPFSGEIYSRVAEDERDVVHAKYLKARNLQPSWAQVPLAERKKIVETFSAILVQRCDALAEILTNEMGKPITQARAEISSTPKRIRFFLDEVDSVLQSQTIEKHRSSEREEITLEPLGVVGNISAWNYPYFVGANVFVPALLTGNTVLYKPSEYATLTGMAIAEIWKQAGLPEGVFQLLTGGGAVGQFLVDQPLGGVFFTGSRGTGIKVAAQAARHTMHVQLELGGKDPAYVREDADLTKAASSLAEGVFYNTGQSCCSVERIYVHRDVYDAFLAKFMDQVRSFRVGNPMEATTFIGPLTRPEQLNVIEDQIREAVGKGAKVALGGKRLPELGPQMFAPTVLTDVNHSMKLMHEESFGPIIGIQKVRGDTDAIALMNDSEYGLTAAVYSASMEKVRTIGQQIHTGSLYANCCDRVSPALPWSGRKGSGVGLTLSREGIRAFLQPKAWHWNKV